jgi:serpin B
MSRQGLELNIANGLWAQQGHAFLPSFLEIAKNDYQANVKQTDFQTGAAAAMTEINRWVAEKTKDKIQQILSPGSLNSQTRLVLVNAIYFKGLWAKPFQKPQTSPQPFQLAGGGQIEVPLMHHFDDVRYMENADFQAVELPYQSNQLSMVILLPRQVDGCAKLEQQLTSALLTNALRQMKSEKVDLFVPRFKLESGFDLRSTLTGMGMTDAFSSKADFSGIDGSRLLYISGVFHKAWGEVNEEGTEAAAATAVGVTAMAIKKPVTPPVFRADHSFIFLIREPRSGSVLFLGRMMQPGKS